MTKILHDCCYDKVKLLHELSCSVWFIEKHALQNAKQSGENELHAALEALYNDLVKHIHTIHDIKCKCS